MYKKISFFLIFFLCSSEFALSSSQLAPPSSSNIFRDSDFVIGTVRERFVHRVKAVRFKYYKELSKISLVQKKQVIKIGKDFQLEIIEAVNEMFSSLKMGDGIVIVSGGSFARSDHVEGSDFDWYFISDLSKVNIDKIKLIQSIFDKASVRFDKDILPRFSVRDRQQLMGDWYLRQERELNLVTVDEINWFYSNSPFELLGKICGTLDVLYICGDLGLFQRVKKIFEKNNRMRKDEFTKKLMIEFNFVNAKKFDVKDFDIKFDKGMIFSIHHIFWLLQLIDDNFSLDLNSISFNNMLNNYVKKGYLAKKEEEVLLEIISFYLLLRYQIVIAHGEQEKQATGYETRYSQSIAVTVAKKIGCQSPEYLEGLILECSNIVVKIYRQIIQRNIEKLGIDEKTIRQDTIRPGDIRNFEEIEKAL